MLRRTLTSLRLQERGLAVITRAPSPAMNTCELVLRERQPIDVTKVEQEHENYNKLFSREVELPMTGEKIKLDTMAIGISALEEFPDSVFVEDVCVMLRDAAILTRPGVESRRGEVAAIEPAVRVVRKNIFSVGEFSQKATADGGDILVAGDFIFIGQSSRTNKLGFEAFQKFGGSCGYAVIPVSVGATSCMHLKCAVTKLDERTLLVNPAWVDGEIFRKLGFDVVEIVSPASEDEAANVLSFCNPLSHGAAIQTVAVSSRFPKNVSFVREWAAERNRKQNDKFWDVTELDVSETAKAEGALTCCSLLAPLFKDI